MGFVELFLIAVGLSMDAFAVAVCKGLALKKFTWKKASIVGAYFGIFQGLMPFIGYILGIQFRDQIEAVDHWVAFVLLLLIGGNMIREALKKDEDDDLSDTLGFKEMLMMAIATSIDALAVGITFAFLKVSIIPAVSFIGITTFLLSAAGVKIGSVFGSKWKNKAEFAGGCILIFMGIKILVEHLS